MTGYESVIPGFSRYSMAINSKEGRYDLHINNVQLDDEGIYECQVGPAPNQTPIRSSAKLDVIGKSTQPFFLQSFEYSLHSHVSWIRILF